MGAFEDYISGSWQGLKRGAQELPENIANWAKPAAVDGIKSYDGALTGTDLPYYGDDEISAAREYFDRQPRSNTSRLVDLIGNYMPGMAASKAAPVAVQAGETVLGAGPAFKQKVAEAALDMAPEARAQRAADQGYTVDAYHGSGADIEAFNPKNLDRKKPTAHFLDIGIHASEAPETANTYANFSQFPSHLKGMASDAKGGTPTVYPVKINPGNVADITSSVPEEIRQRFVSEMSGKFSPATMKKYTSMMDYDPLGALAIHQKTFGNQAARDLFSGYDSVRYNWDEGNQRVVFDPSQVRSRFAAFDPAKAGSSDLLAAHANPLSQLQQMYRDREER